MKLTLNKSKWLRGEGSENSYLLRPKDGKMCCIGQFCHQVGIPEKDLDNIQSLDELILEPTKAKELYSILRFLYNTINEQTETATLFYKVNDNKYTSDETKLEQIKAMLAEFGIELEVIENEICIEQI